MATLSAKEVQERAQNALRASPIHALQRLQVEDDGERLLICGRVGSFYHKQLAQEVVRSVADGLLVVNKTQVTAPNPVQDEVWD